VNQQTNAKQAPITGHEALAVLDGVQLLYVATGKSFVSVDLAHESPGPAALEKLLLGPTGKLRAPTLRKGKKLIVGFHEDMYRQAGL
jgi:hypothetical protein